MSAQRVKFRLQEDRYSCNEPPASSNNLMMPRQQSTPSTSVSTEEETAMTAAQRSTTSGGTTSTIKTDEGNWRKPGRIYRARLTAQDDKEGGGKAFRISSHCAIERYYQVADKVQYQFLNHPVDTKDEFIEAYLVGTRLCKFLSGVLPTHDDYYSNEPKLVALRAESQAQLAELLPYLDQLERVIDEDEHQLYISQILGTEAEVDQDDDAVDDDDDWEDVEEEDKAVLQDQKLHQQPQLLKYQHQYHPEQQRQQQQLKQQHPELQKDNSVVNTTMTSYEWTANNPDESLDMDLILDGDNSLIDSCTGEDLHDQRPLQTAQPTPRPPLQSSMRAPPKISPPPKTKQTPRRSPLPSLRESPTSTPSSSSSRNLESPSQLQPQRAAAVNWDTAWQRSALQQSSPKQQQQRKSSSSGTSNHHQLRHAPVIVQETDSQDDDSVWSPTATLQERVSELSPVRHELSPIRPLRVQLQHRDEQQQQRNISLVAVASRDELSQDPPIRPQEHRHKSTAAAATTCENKADDWAQIPDNEYRAKCTEMKPHSNSNRTVDEWNLPYSAVSPDWVSVSSSTDTTNDLASEWTMNLSMSSSAFHQKQAPSTPATSTLARVSPLLPPRGVTKIKHRERRRRTVTPMTKLPPVQEFPSISKLPSARPSNESSLSNNMRQEEDFVDHIASAFVDQDTDLVWDSKIERRWHCANRNPPRTRVGNHSFTSFTTLREGSPKSIIDMDVFNDDFREDASRKAKEYGKQTLLFDKYQSSDVSVGSSMNVSPSAAPTRKQESLRRLGEDPDESESFVDNRALTRRGRALQPFKSCVRCLLD